MNEPGILVEHDASPMKLEVLGAEDWPQEMLSVSRFERQYPQTVTVFVVSGNATLEPVNGANVEIGEGDLVTFLPGTSCTWRVSEPLEVHTRVG